MRDEKVLPAVLQEIGEGGRSQEAVSGARRIALVGLQCESVPWTPTG